jgi:hypothetical protein
MPGVEVDPVQEPGSAVGEQTTASAERVRRLNELRESGAITADEYERLLRDA